MPGFRQSTDWLKSHASDTEREIDADLSFHRQRLQRHRFARAADQEVGTDAEADRNVAAGADGFSRQRARRDGGRARQHRPRHHAAGSDADIEAKAADGADVILGPAALRSELTTESLARSNEEADTSGRPAGQYPLTDRVALRRGGRHRKQERRQQRRTNVVHPR